jgi:hypothetical protein
LEACSKSLKNTTGRFRSYTQLRLQATKFTCRRKTRQLSILLLKVLDKYGSDVTWIGRVNAKNEWAVAFHGTNAGAVSSIVKSGLAPSTTKRDAMLHEAVLQKGESVNKAGLYVATHCEDGSHPQYTTPFTVTSFPGRTEKYSIVFQCRVEPDKYTVHSLPVKKGHAWRVVDPNAIRPYGILLKKEE